MKRSRELGVLGILSIIMAMFAAGCQNTGSHAVNPPKESFYGAPPPASAMPQIEAAKKAQEKAMAAGMAAHHGPGNK